MGALAHLSHLQIFCLYIVFRHRDLKKTVVLTLKNLFRTTLFKKETRVSELRKTQTHKLN